MSDSFASPWPAAHQAPLSMGFPRQKYWSGLPFPSPGVLPSPGIEPESPALAGRLFNAEPPGLLLLLSHFNCVQLLVTQWTAAYQAPPSMGFSRQEYWRGGAIAFSGATRAVLWKRYLCSLITWNQHAVAHPWCSGGLVKMITKGLFNWLII